jgi:predicted Zn-dependent protease
MVWRRVSASASSALLVLAACAPAGESPSDVPLPTSLSDVLIEARVAEARAAIEAGQDDAWLELAQVYDANDLDELALATYARALERERPSGASEVRARYHRARVLAELGRGAEALAAFDELREAAGDYAPLWARRGELLFELGLAAEARVSFERALALAPGGVPQRLGLARVLLFAGEAAAAEATLAELAREQPRERLVHGLRARAAQARGDESGAREALEREARASRTTLDDPWTAEVETRRTGIENAVRAAGAALAGDDPEAALARLEPLYRQAPGDFALIEALARARNAARKHAQALALVEDGLARHPARFQLELQGAIAAFGLGRLAEARAYAERAFALNPARGATLALVGEVRLRQGEPTAAEDALLAAVERGEREPRTRALLAEAQLAGGAFERAAATLAELAREAPRNATVWAQLAEARAGLGDLAGAHEALRAAEALDPACAALPAARARLGGAEVAR